ncbi:MAG TPA: hypothetical protein ENN43_03180 [bacterium]|nr:hypothetical protein [bacterium]
MIRLVLFFIIAVKLAAAGGAVFASQADADFERAVNLYLGGDAEAAALLMEKAVKNEPENPKYEAFYAVLAEERESLIIIDSGLRKETVKDGRKKSAVAGPEGFSQYYMLLNEINRRIDKVRDEAAAGTEALKAGLEASEKRADENAEKARVLAERLEKESSVVVKVLAAILFFILLLLFVNIYILRGLKRAEAAVKYLTLRQDENSGRIGRIEERGKNDETGL